MNQDLVNRLFDMTTPNSLNNFIGRTGSKCFKAVKQFTRPAGTTQYTADDAITNSETAPAVLEFDLANDGAVKGQFFMITNASIISSVKGSVTDLNANIWLYPVTFAATNDNSALSIDDVSSATGGIIIPCANAYRTALNHRCISDMGAYIGKLDSANTKLFGTLQASNAYTPADAEVLTVVLLGMLL